MEFAARLRMGGKSSPVQSFEVTRFDLDAGYDRHLDSSWLATLCDVPCSAPPQTGRLISRRPVLLKLLSQVLLFRQDRNHFHSGHFLTCRIVDINTQCVGVRSDRSPGVDI